MPNPKKPIYYTLRPGVTLKNGVTLKQVPIPEVKVKKDYPGKKKYIA